MGSCNGYDCVGGANYYSNKAYYEIDQNNYRITCRILEERMEKFENHNHDSHVKIWAHNDKQDEQLAEHENRISLLEERK